MLLQKQWSGHTDGQNILAFTYSQTSSMEVDASMYECMILMEYGDITNTLLKKSSSGCTRTVEHTVLQQNHSLP